MKPIYRKAKGEHLWELQPPLFKSKVSKYLQRLNLRQEESKKLIDMNNELNNRRKKNYNEEVNADD